MGLPAGIKRHYTYEEYRILEETQPDVRYEYHLGEVFAMAGTTKNHNRIVRNLANRLDESFLPQGCEVFTENIKVEVKTDLINYYPDVVVSCSDRDRENSLIVKDPVLIIEVLSEGSHKADIYGKQAYYTNMAALQVYMVVSQKEYLLHVYERHADGWTYQVVLGKDQQLHLEALDLVMSVADIYKNVIIER